ncbi:L-seryl-tRNA(Sec) selenium transferase [Clostridium polyendosporum]|uniref:L-seryl-tRNA(Sec) selenium transferase n=1 Tax=Clostridium polyendosporum TaxID=69208 RepID=A0A919RZT4_9CLOT|nr:L-seryl-tRNA(Sec) selenium transferase [Clostridium polyendosporum]GIM29227.1 L-seryl-tRNA(Sec) selenium transferase [Clostridium polyendosporum]
MNNELLRTLTKVDEMMNHTDIVTLLRNNSRKLVLDCVREAINYYRNAILEEKVKENVSIKTISNKTIEILERKKTLNLKRVVNGAGIVIHTNLGRSILSNNAIENMINVSKYYNNLEYDLEKGKRGSRYAHIEELIKSITGAEGALVVNNNAAAVLLVLNTLCEGKEAVVSRGQLVEIGGSFRIPEVMKFSGAKLVEVGTTNRTHLYDYRDNISENTGVFLKVHTSNFKILGFTEDVKLEDLVVLGGKNNIPVVEDIGSGVLVDLSKYGLSYEPTVQESIKKGADIVTFSGDKMLGGPQVGFIIGKKEYIDKIKKNQLTRALRVDKFTLAALEGTLRHYLDEEEAVKHIPTLNMMILTEEELKRKAKRLKRKLSSLKNIFSVSIKEDNSMVGGGSMPATCMKTYVININSSIFSEKQIEEGFRKYKIPIITRVYSGSVLIDVRTLLEEDYNVIYDALKEMGERA